MSEATPRTPLETANDALDRETPALAAALSPLGRRVVFPPDIPFQAAQARGKRFNATLGQITDGAGGAVRLPSLAEGLEGLPEDLIDRALLYSPVQGIEEVRRLWRDRQRRLAGVGDDVPSSLPVVTVGLTHGLSIAADLFGGEDTPVAVPTPFWGNYRQAFATRTGARMVSAPFYDGGVFAPDAVSRALADEPEGRPAVAILNFPSNPHGYMPSEDERQALRAELVREAGKRPLVALCDDAYAGLVFDDSVPRRSLFWDLIGAHPRLVPVKIDGATKEVSYFGGRVGFVTFAVPPESDAAAALESKVKCLLRATLGSPVATSQVLLLQALRSETLDDEIEDLRLLLARRARTLAQALDGLDRSLLRPLPMNSGCFALTELPEELGLTAEQVRLHLLDHEDAGVVSIAPRYLRIAFCSVSEETLPELVERIERGVRHLVDAGTR
jgi:aspartate/methionine/tyrosine aminotransferase